MHRVNVESVAVEFLPFLCDELIFAWLDYVG